MKLPTVIIATLISIFILSACSTNDSHHSSASVGDIVELGGFDWRVIGVQDGNALVISEKILWRSTWHYEQTVMSWEASEIRQYLNGPFFDNGFTDEEKALIIETQLPNNMNPWFGSAGAGSDTMDRVFLLSLEEVIYYFGDSGMLSGLAGRPAGDLAIPIMDEYNEGRIATDAGTGSPYWWWLRTPGRFVHSWVDASATAVSGGGDVIVYGLYMVMEGGVRPAMWLRL